MKPALWIAVLLAVFYGGQLIYDHYLMTDQAKIAKAARTR